MRMHRRRRAAINVPTTSMGDIAFLLIIFFMVCSNFAKESGIKIKAPQAPDIEQIKESKVSVAIDAQGAIYLNGVAVSDAQGVEWGVAALLTGRTNDLQRTVMFKCDKEIDKSVFEPVLAAISKAGGLVAAIGEKQK